MTRSTKCLVLSLSMLNFAHGDVDVERAFVDAALMEDDQCAVSGVDGAICALKALQVKAEKLAEEEAVEAGEEFDACKFGIVGQIRSHARACLDACPQVCGPLGKVVRAFITRGHKDPISAVKPVVCKYQREFSCPVSSAENVIKCAPIYEQAKAFKITVPDSVDKLHAFCA